MQSAYICASGFSGVYEASGTRRSARPLRAGGTLDASIDDFNDQRPTARDLYADELLNEGERTRARASCRKLVCDNPTASHIVLAQMLSVMGSPATLKIKAQEASINHFVEERFRRWCDDTLFWDAVSMMVQALPYDGEAFARIRFIGTPQMKVKNLDPKRISSPPDVLADPNVLDGIEYDEFEEPAAYWVERKTVNPIYSHRMEWDRCCAAEILHLFKPTFPEQHRGHPMLDSSGRPLRAIEDLRMETIEGTRVAARLAGVISSETPFDSDDEYAPAAMDAIRLPRRGFLFLGNNMKASQFKTDPPGTNFKEFHDTNVTIAGAAAMTPRNIATNDSSAYNYSSARLDHQIFDKWVSCLRNSLRSLLDKVFNVWMASHCQDPAVAQLIAEYGAITEVPRVWFFEESELDPQAGADVNVTLITNNLKTLKDYYAEKNKDWRSELEQIGTEKRLLQELGITAEEAVGTPPVQADGTASPSPGASSAVPPADSPPPPPVVLQRLRSAGEISSETGISKTQLSSWARRGLISSYKLGGRVLFDPETIHAYISNGHRPALPNPSVNPRQRGPDSAG